MSRTKFEAIIPLLKSESHYLTSGFGPRTVNGKESYHNGCDFVGGDDKVASTDYVIAFESGKVTKATNDVSGKTPSEGNAVIIDHGNGIKTYYFHLKEGSVTVKKGDLISRGDVIGYMGNTGNSTGAHLHFGLKINNMWTDPAPYLTGEKDLGFHRFKTETRALRRGYKGPDVLFLQKFLNLEYGASLTLDGSYGAKTEAAVKSFQKSSSLAVDGIFGRKSMSELFNKKK